MARKKKKKPPLTWDELKRRYRMNDDDVLRAQALGMTPKTLMQNKPKQHNAFPPQVRDWVRQSFDDEFGFRGYPEPYNEPLCLVESLEDELGHANYENLLADLPLPPNPSAEPESLLVRQQRELMYAAKYAAYELLQLPEVVHIDAFGAVLEPLKKPIPDFTKFKKHRLPVWMECPHIDLAVSMSGLGNLKALQTARGKAMMRLLNDRRIALPHQVVRLWIMDPRGDRYHGMLCSFDQCPKNGHEECRVDGCGVQPFLQQFRDWEFDHSKLQPSRTECLFRRDHRYDRHAADFDDDVPF